MQKSVKLHQSNRMSTKRKSITFTEEQDNWIRKRINNGDFTNDSEYIRSLVRKDKDENEKLFHLKIALKAGLESGSSNKSVLQIMEEVEKRINGNR